MEKSKLPELLKAFSNKERKSFVDFVRSPYFNRDAEVVQLNEHLVDQIKFGKPLERQTVFGALFPDLPYDEARLNHLMSFSLKLAEQFIGLRQLDEHPGLESYMVLQGLSKMGLEKHYRFLFEKTMERLETAPVQSSGYFLNRFWLESQEADRPSPSSVRGGNEYVQRAVDNLDSFYLSEKLRYACYMLTSQKIMAVPYQLNLVDEIIQFISGHPDFLAAPAIHGYYRVARLLTQDQASEDFAALKALIHQQSAHIPPQILEELYQYAINYCHLQIRKFDDQQPHVAEALELYIQAIETGVLLQQGHISPGNFKNIIKLSLIQQQYDWTEQFILRYSRLLDPDYREDALHYNLAELYYSTNRPDEAMIHLNQVEFSDLQYNLGAKVLLSRIYYETGAVDALESLLHAFKTYLHRNRVITQETRRLYLNFIRFLSAIVRSTPETRERIRGKLEQTSQVTLKKWLLSIL